MLDIPTEYCEQLLQIGWEPINTLSNLAFVVAGLTAIYVLRNQKGVLKYILPLLLILVSLGSSWWHISHSYLGDIADTLFILIFASITGIFFLKDSLQFWTAVIFSFVILLIATLFAEQFPYINNSLPYVVLLVGFVIGGVFYVTKYPKYRVLIITAALTFALAIFFRSIDMLVCSEIAIGTHFLWHVLVAVFGYQLIMLTAKK
jgi:hypothetical protein